MKTATIAMLAASALTLAACSAAKEPEQPAAETNMVEITAPENIANVTTEAPPAPRIENSATAAESSPPPMLSADEQTQQDADATGMTAKVNRDEAGNTARPAE